jgi:hypothetical protein
VISKKAAIMAKEHYDRKIVTYIKEVMKTNQVRQHETISANLISLYMIIDFYENMRHGYGELNEFKINQGYQGQWYYNKRHGQGVQRFNDGSTYTGDWIRDKRQGHGELEYLDGTYYDGQWRNDV